jgi:threonine aldolase
MCNGAPLTAEYTAQAAHLAHGRGLRVHLDGARIFNAAATLGIDARELVRDVDSVMFCLSKGLCAPVGSLLCGDTAFIAEARRARKVVGGGMRQAGVLAAAGVVALEQMTERVAEDHTRAKRLAEGLAQISGIAVTPPASNILYFQLTDETTKTQDDIVNGLAEHGILLLGRLEGRFRAVIHYWIDDEDIIKTIQVLQATM